MARWYEGTEEKRYGGKRGEGDVRGRVNGREDERKGRGLGGRGSGEEGVRGVVRKREGGWGRICTEREGEGE